MSVKLMSLVWERTDLSQSETLVMLALADRADDHGRCWPSIEGIAERARVTARSVQRIMHDLKTRGFLAVEVGGGRGHTNRYLLNVEHLKGDASNAVSTSPFIEKGDASEQETLTPVTQKGDTAMSPESSRTVIEPPKLNRDAWRAWVAYRKERKHKPYTATGACRQMEWLAKFASDEQSRIVEESMRQGYQGLFEPKSNGTHQQKPNAFDAHTERLRKWADGTT